MNYLTEKLISKLLFYPESEIKTKPEDYNIHKYENIYINTKGKNKLHGWLIPGDSDKYVIYLHGTKGNIGTYLKGIKKLTELNVNVLVADYQGFGKSRGEALISNSIEDSILMYDFLVSDKKINPKNINLWGYSYGGAITPEIASIYDVNSIVLECTFSSLHTISNEKYPLIAGLFVPKNILNTKETLKKTKSKVLISYAEHDETIPASHSFALYDHAPKEKHLFKIENARHDNICDHVTEEYNELIKKVIFY